MLVEENNYRLAVEVTQIINAKAKQVQNYVSLSPWALAEKLKMRWSVIFLNSGGDIVNKDAMEIA